MTEREDHPIEPAARLKTLLCKRTGEKVKLREHELCPYCFGRMAAIKTGLHERFCDYREGVDPVHFGFPADDPRFGRG